MSHPKGACPRGGSTNHNQGEGVGADYVNVYAKSIPFYSGITVCNEINTLAGLV